MTQGKGIVHRRIFCTRCGTFNLFVKFSIETIIIMLKLSLREALIMDEQGSNIRSSITSEGTLPIIEKSLLTTGTPQDVAYGL